MSLPRSMRRGSAGDDDVLPNEQIGARPLISEHTVDTHIRNILNKLGFNSRTQIAVWMASADR